MAIQRTGSLPWKPDKMANFQPYVWWHTASKIQSWNKIGVIKWQIVTVVPQAGDGVQVLNVAHRWTTITHCPLQVICCVNQLLLEQHWTEKLGKNESTKIFLSYLIAFDRLFYNICSNPLLTICLCNRLVFYCSTNDLKIAVFNIWQMSALHQPVCANSWSTNHWIIENSASVLDINTHHCLLHVNFLAAWQAKVCYLRHKVVAYKNIPGCQIPVDELMPRGWRRE